MQRSACAASGSSATVSWSADDCGKIRAQTTKIRLLQNLTTLSFLATNCPDNLSFDVVRFELLPHVQLAARGQCVKVAVVALILSPVSTRLHSVSSSTENYNCCESTDHSCLAVKMDCLDILTSSWKWFFQVTAAQKQQWKGFCFEVLKFRENFWGFGKTRENCSGLKFILNSSHYNSACGLRHVYIWTLFEKKQKTRIIFSLNWDSGNMSQQVPSRHFSKHNSCFNNQGCHFVIRRSLHITLVEDTHFKMQPKLNVYKVKQYN